MASTVALVAALAACAPGRPGNRHPSGEKACPRGRASAETQAIPSASWWRNLWKDIYPNEYQTYGQQVQQPPGQTGLLTEYPELVTMYAGYGFAKEATTRRQGIPYSLQSVAETPRVNGARGQLHHLQDAPVHHGELRGRFGLQALRRGAHADDQAHQLLQL